jgi:hypothetical protein
MMQNERKEVMIVIIIAAICLLTGLFLTWSRSDIPEITGSTQALDKNDFTIKIGNEKLYVGSSSWDSAAAIFPGGKTLGMSTVYSNAPDDYLLSFTNKSNVLYKADLYSPRLSTYRNVKTGMGVEQVKNIYGDNFVKISHKNSTQEYDMIYGTESNRIVFNIKNNQVWRIVVEHESK